MDRAGRGLEPADLVLELQLAALEFDEFEIVRRGACDGVVDFAFDRPMTLFELREMSLQGHAIVSFILPNVIIVTWKLGQVEGFDVVRRTIDVRRGIPLQV